MDCHEFASAICEAIGVDPGRVSKIVMTIESGNPPEFLVTIPGPIRENKHPGSYESIAGAVVKLLKADGA